MLDASRRRIERCRLAIEGVAVSDAIEELDRIRSELRVQTWLMTLNAILVLVILVIKL